MKQILLVSMILMVSLLYGCGGSDVQKPISPVDSTNRSDDLILGYRFGMDNATGRAVTDSLLSKGIFSLYTSKKIKYDGKELEIYGYPYTYKLGDKRIKTLVKPFFKDRRLERLDIYLLDSKGVYKELEKIYGQGNAIPKGYRPEVPDNIINFWNTSNKAIYFMHFPTKDAKGGYDVLVLEDILSKMKTQDRAPGPTVIVPIK